MIIEKKKIVGTVIHKLFRLIIFHHKLSKDHMIKDVIFGQSELFSIFWLLELHLLMAKLINRF